MLSTLSQWLQPAARPQSTHSNLEEADSVANQKEKDNATTTKSRQQNDVPTIESSSPPVADKSTPKAQPSGVEVDVPSFNLDESNIPEVEETERILEISKQADLPPATSKSVTSMSAPNVPAKSSAGLMPPPSRKVPTLKPPPSGAASSLSVPARGPVPNRGPPSLQAAQARSGLAPPTNKSGGRGQVVLKPGHSPLDWATLSQSNNLAGVPGLQRVTPSALKQNNGRKGRLAWSSYNGKVYNIKPYLPFHPGGEGELLRAAGKDGTKLFMEAHSWINWENMLNSCLVGIMVSEAEGEGLDGLD